MPAPAFMTTAIAFPVLALALAAGLRVDGGDILPGVAPGPAVASAGQPTQAASSGGQPAPGDGAAAVPSEPLGCAAGPRSEWRWPLAAVPTAPAVLRRFAVGPHPWSPGHRGVDLAATPGSAVLAPAAGCVTFAGLVAGRGVLVLTHPGGLRTSYEPVVATAPTGIPVSPGTRIAVLGPQGLSHCPATGCLHWGARLGDRYVDPLSLLGLTPPIVLLPMASQVTSASFPRSWSTALVCI